MLRYLVSIDGAPAAERFVMLHSLRVAPGTLCEISIDGHMQLYVVERVATLILSVRRQHPVPLLLGPHAA